MFTETLQIGIIVRDLEGVAPDLESVAEIAEPAPGADLDPEPDAVHPPAR
jgi:hypothetical protein